MSRNVTLNEIVEQVRSECRLSTSTSRGLDDLANIKQMISRVQETLYDEYDWPFMRIDKEEATKVLAAGQRYYDFPVTMNMERGTELWHNYGGNVWTRLEQGIGMQEYSEQDSDGNDRSDPAIKWDIHNETQYEIWPLPASNGGLVRFDGVKKLNPLITAESRADLDDKLIVLFVSAEILSANKQNDAQAKVELAQRRLATVRGRFASQKRLFMGGQPPADNREYRIRVPRVSL